MADQLRAEFEKYSSCFFTAKTGTPYWVWNGELDPEEMAYMLQATAPFRLKPDQKLYSVQTGEPDGTGKVIYRRSDVFAFPARAEDIQAGLTQLGEQFPGFWEYPISIWPTSNPALTKIARHKPSFL